MKRYASIKGHEVRIGGGGRVDKQNRQILKEFIFAGMPD